MPLLNQILERLQLEPLLRQYLPKDDPRCEFPTSQALVLLVPNVLISRAPVYARFLLTRVVSCGHFTSRTLPEHSSWLTN